MTEPATAARPSPGALWMQAHDEHPHDSVARKVRYHELLREHGLLVDRKPGDDPNLPCGWPGVPTDPEANERLRADLAAVKEAEQEALRNGR